MISGAGHHVYADRSDVFNQHVEKACQLADEPSKLMTGKMDLDQKKETISLVSSDTEEEMPPKNVKD